MPSLNFVLPHWLYWSGLVIFPLVAAWLIAHQRRNGPPRGTSLFIAYMFWLLSGFLGIHRIYLKSGWAVAFIAVFIGILVVNGDIRDAREDVSRTRSAYDGAHTAMLRARPTPSQAGNAAVQERFSRAQEEEARREADYKVMSGRLDHWRDISRWMAIAMAGLLLIDAALIPRRVRQLRAREVEVPEAHEPLIVEGPPPEDPTRYIHSPLTDPIEWLNVKAGTFVAYWAVLAVLAYYYEVIARFVFNSPTNWVHESMFLMFGMQYMLSGAFAYREDQHVRVDVLYAKFSPRGKAIADIVTSVFFFIFAGTMMVTGWRFALDAINLTEHSFTEWGVQYWPVKLTMPIGAALILLQGLARLLKDIAIVTRRAA